MPASLVVYLDSSRRLSAGLLSPTHDNPAQVIDQKTKEFVEKVVGIVEKFLNEDENEELMLDPCNSYLRYVFFFVYMSYSDIIVIKIFLTSSICLILSL